MRNLQRAVSLRKFFVQTMGLAQGCVLAMAFFCMLMRAGELVIQNQQLVEDRPIEVDGISGAAK